MVQIISWRRQFSLKLFRGSELVVGAARSCTCDSSLMFCRGRCRWQQHRENNKFSPHTSTG